MKRYLLWFFLGILIYVLINVGVAFTDFGLKRSINHQINYIAQSLDGNADVDLQKVYPEGMSFANAIFALSLIDYKLENEMTAKHYSKIVDQCVLRLLSSKNKANFTKDLEIPYGAFYNGWCNFVLKQYTESVLFDHSDYQLQFIEAHDSISQEIVATQLDSFHLLDSYQDAIWPADNLACIASLSHQLEYQSDWLTAIENTSESQLNLIHHFDQRPTVVRGSSQALINYFVSTFDESRAQQNVQIYKDHFVDDILGLQFVKEYSDGGEGDIDSGPLLFGYGSVATIVNIKAQSSVNDNELKFTWGLLNALGLPIHLGSEKYYLFKQELIFDIFMLWTSVELLENQ